MKLKRIATHHNVIQWNEMFRNCVKSVSFHWNCVEPLNKRILILTFTQEHRNIYIFIFILSKLVYLQRTSKLFNACEQHFICMTISMTLFSTKPTVKVSVYSAGY